MRNLDYGGQLKVPFEHTDMKSDVLMGTQNFLINAIIKNMCSVMHNCSFFYVIINQLLQIE